jgi:hypothetical protein
MDDYVVVEGYPMGVVLLEDVSDGLNGLRF